MSATNTTKKSSRPLFLGIIIAMIAIVIGIVAVFFALSGSSEAPASTAVEADTNMTTNQYTTDITLMDTGGTLVTEHIDVSFNPERHGIYRYISSDGVLNYKLDNKTHSEYYNAYVIMKDCNVTYEESTEGSYNVFQFGDADKTVTEQVYDFTYEIEPEMNTTDLQVAYINIFPTRWQNVIPAGSSFTIHFPNGYEKKALKFYSGELGSDADASSLLDLTFTENEVTGSLTKDLELGSGITMFADMGKGYFNSVSSADQNVKGDIHIMIFVLVASLILFLLFGITAKPITSIQYSAPAGQDSATIGFILDGTVDDKDISSLILYWANQGNLRIRENKKGNLTLVWLKDLPADAPKHQTILFNELFSSKKEKDMSKLGATYGHSVSNAKDEIKNAFKKGSPQGAIYSRISKIPRRIALVLSGFPMFVYVAGAWGNSTTGLGFSILAFLTICCNIAGIWKMNSTFKNWNSMASQKRLVQLIMSVLLMVATLIVFVITDKIQADHNLALNYAPGSIWIILGTPVAALFASNIRRRTKRGTELMGWILGIRDFIETAELDRINAMAEEHPDWFYHLLPYAYVLGLTETWVHKLDALGIEVSNPEWYSGTGSMTEMHMLHSFQNSMDSIETSIASSVAAASAVDAVLADRSSSDDSFGGGSDGGFSGGGFGGGGGGSW